MEISDNPSPQGGLYRHPNGTEVVTLDDPLYGSPQSAAAVRAGFERVGDVPEGYVKTFYETNTDAPSNVSAGDLKGIQARLDAQDAKQAELEAENAALKAAAATTVPKAKN
jgi:hypothetical protein